MPTVAALRPEAEVYRAKPSKPADRPKTLFLCKTCRGASDHKNPCHDCKHGLVLR